MTILPRAMVALRRAPTVLVGKGLGALCVALVIAAWFLVTAGAAEERLVSPTLLPAPLEVLGAVPALAADGALVEAILATLRRVLAGFLLAVAIGVPLGMAAGAWRALGSFLAPI